MPGKQKEIGWGDYEPWRHELQLACTIWQRTRASAKGGLFLGLPASRSVEDRMKNISLPRAAHAKLRQSVYYRDRHKNIKNQPYAVPSLAMVRRIFI